MSARDWPAIPYGDWAGTCAALHLWCQIVGKVRLSRTPWQPHSWHATLYPVPRGLTTGTIPNPRGPSQSILLDLVDHRLVVEAEGGAREGFDLRPMSVADFHARTREAVKAAGGTFAIHGAPNELPDPVPFTEDTAERPYDADAVSRFHRALLRANEVMERYRTAYLGKSSPVHLFWGSFDLAVTRFSGHEAPPHPGGIPHLPDAITREAYSHEVASAGFWPGNGGAGEAMFYAYAYPTPDGFAEAPVEPEAARWDADLGEFLLPYEAVRTAGDPEAALMAFLRSSYAAAAERGGFDREGLDAPLGEPGRVRPLRA